MRIEDLSRETQDGLRVWSRSQNGEDVFEYIGEDPVDWGWIVYRLRNAEDRTEWFPRGKWAVIQVIEERLGGK